MTYSTYTHKFVIKNSNEVLHNASLDCFKASDKIHHLGQNTQDQAISGNSILVPGFINLHCHLAYNKIKLKRQGLFTWLKDLVAHCQDSDKYSPRLNVLDALDDLLKFGTTFTVDNGSYLNESFEVLSQGKIKALLGVEVFGSDPQKAQEIFEKAVELVEEYEAKESQLEFCLSPHAIYDVSKELWQLCKTWSEAKNKILLSHISETQEEELMQQDFTHPKLREAKEFWQSINTLKVKEDNWQSYQSAVDFLKVNDLLYDKLLLAHGVYCSQEDLETLAQAQVKLVNCPRSNAFLQNACADTQKWQELGIDFAFGTDSKASNEDIDIRQEVMQNTHLSSKEKFEKLTIAPAKILGKDQDIGSLEPGKYADMVVLEPIDPEAQVTPENIFDFVVDPQKTYVKEVYINNSNVYRSGS